MYNNISEIFENSKVRFRVEYEFIKDPNDPMRVMEDIENSIEYKVRDFSLIERNYNYGEQLVTYIFTATLI